MLGYKHPEGVNNETMMDSQSYIEYELVEPISTKVNRTRDYDEALAYFDRGWIVYEHHIMVCKPSDDISTLTDVSRFWSHNNKGN